MKLPRHILFDFFGTLVDYHAGVRGTRPGRTIAFLEQLAGVEAGAVPGHVEAAYEALEAEASATLREYHTFDAMRALLGRLGVEPVDGEVAELARAWIDDWSVYVRPPSGLEAALGAIDAPKSIVSNTATPWLVPDCVRRFGLELAFDRIVTSVETGFRKPHGTIYREALERAGVEAGEALFVGDNPECDYFGPRRFGMRAVLVSVEPVEGVAESDRIDSVLQLEDWLSS